MNKNTLFSSFGKWVEPQRTSALNILINAITVWNTVYLTEATKILNAKGLLKEELLPHISPLG